MAELTWKNCNIIVCNPKTAIHPLYLNIQPRHSHILGLSDKQKLFTCCLRWRLSNGKSGDWISLFVTVRVSSNTTKTDEAEEKTLNNGDNVILYASDVFIRHYGLNSYSSVVGFQVRRLDCVSLTSVVFRARSPAVYSWAVSESDWKTHLLAKCCQQPVLCRTNDVCMAPLSNRVERRLEEVEFLFGLVALDCQPVSQGVLGPDTSLTILDCEQNEAVTTKNDAGRIQKSPKNVISRIMSLVLVSDFVLVLLAPFLYRLNDLKRAKHVIQMVGMTNKLGLQWTTKLKIQVIPKPPVITAHRDVHNIIHVTRTWIQKYKIKHGSWAQVWLRTNCTAGKIKKRLVQVYSLQEAEDEVVFGELKDSVAYITPQLWFNLNNHPSKLVQLDARLCFQPASMDVTLGPNFAQEIKVSCVHSPTSVPHAEQEELLKRYFEIPRCVRIDDVITLTAKNDLLGGKEDDAGLNVTHFVVTKLLPENEIGLLVNRSNSTLFQGSSVLSYVPMTMGSYFSSRAVHPIWDSPFPVGLNKYSEELCQIVLPYLRSYHLRGNDFPTVCLRGPACCGKMTVAKSVSKMLNLKLFVADCWEMVSESSGASAARLKATFQKASLYSPCLLILKNVHILLSDFETGSGESILIYKMQKLLAEMKNLDYPLIVIGITSMRNYIDSDLTRIFVNSIQLQVPNNTEKIQMLSVLLRQGNLSADISLSSLVKNTSGYVLGDLVSLTSRAIQCAYRRLSEMSNDEDVVCLSGVRLLACDFYQAFDSCQSAQADALGAPQIPQVRWDDVGGLEEVKLELLNSLKLPLEYPELLATGLRRSGVLFYGPPGTGKTLLAKAVATEFSMSFISVKGPELLNMYVGQSEENVRKIFEKARDASPSIVFFDEMDSLAPNRGRSGDSGGVMDRVVSQLLAEIDGLCKFSDVFVMAATNRLDLIDPALLRPGRFDKLMYVGISEDRPSQLKILKALTKKFNLGRNVDLNALIDKCPSHLTGADFYALCSDALLAAITRKIEDLNSKDVMDDDEEVLVNQEDFLSALENLVPSVSPDILKSYSSITSRSR